MIQRPIPISTIGQLLERNYMLTGHCPECLNSKVFDLTVLSARLGLDFDYVDQRLGEKLVCSKCGEKGAMITIAPPTTLVPRSIEI